MIDLDPLHILAVDDDPGILETIGGVIAALWPQARYITAEDGDRGLQLARQERPDVILLDLVLPRLSGLAVCRRLKEDPATRDIPIVVMTGFHADGEHRRTAVEAGVDGFLVKPFDVAELEVVIRSMTRLFRSVVLERSVQQHLSSVVERRTEELQKELKERREVEERLRQSEERFRLLVERSRDILYTLDAGGVLRYVSPAVGPVLGYHPAQLTGRPIAPYVHPDDLPSVLKVLRRSFQEGFQSNGTELRFKHADGSWRWIVGRGEIVEATASSPAMFMGLAHDVTDRRMADEALAASEARFRSLFEHAPVSIWEEDFSAVGAWLDAIRMLGVKDLDAYLDEDPGRLEAAVHEIRVLDVNETSLRMFEAGSREELIDNLPRIFKDETYRMFREELKAIWEGRSQVDIEFSGMTLRGRPIDYLVHWAAPTQGGQPDLTRVIVAIVDVTERNQATSALRESEERYRQLFEAESDAILLVDNETGRILEANSAACQLYGRSREDLLKLQNTDLSAEESETRRITRETPVEMDRVVTIPLRYHRRVDGSVVPVEITGRFFMWNGRAVHIAAIRDITRRLNVEEEMRRTQAELSRALDLANWSRKALLSMVEDVRMSKARLEESEARLRMAVSAGNQGIFDLNIRTGDATVSPEYAQMLGYDPLTFRETNQAWLDRLHPEDRNKVGEVYRQYVSGEIPEYRVEFRQRTIDGGWKWVLSMGRVIERDADGSPLRMLGTHTDIHAMKQMEAQLRAAAEQTRSLLRKLQDVRELERRDLARELHDELGQELTAIKMDLRLLERALEEPAGPQKAERLAVRLESLRALGDRAIMTTRQLTTRLRPEVLDRLGFGQAVTWFAHQWHERNGLTCEVDVDPALQTIGDPTATTLFRVVQEGLTNVVKHARATRVTVSVHRSDNHIRLEITDDGVGYAPDRARTDSFGLLGLGERVEALGGTLQIGPAETEGTRLSVSVPIASDESNTSSSSRTSASSDAVSSVQRHERPHRRDTASARRSQD